MSEVAITELLEIDPDRVDAVLSPANGTEWLVLKAISDDTVTEVEATIEDVLAELDKAAGETRPPCPLCKGSKTIKDGGLKCPKCKGTGFAPKVGETEKDLLEAAKETGVAASGADVPVLKDCPTCNGGGNIEDGTTDGKTCPDCGGSGKDGKLPDDDSLKTMNAPDGQVRVGDPQHREQVDKSIDLYDDDETDLEKAKLKTKARDALPDSAFALPETREYPIQDENHGRAALSMLHNASPADQKKIKAAVHRRYPDIGADDDAQKADGSMFTGPNPQLAAMATKVGGDDAGSGDSGGGDAPGSPAWEAVDAATATEAALALMAAGEMIRTFAQREAIEVAAGEGNDIFDTMAAEQALCGVSHALGIMASMAFHEGLEAAKSLDDNDVAEKAGKRLSTRSVSALAAARDHINELLGKDDPAKTDDDKKDGPSAADKFIANANKAQLAKEIEDMSTDELEKVLDARDEKLVGLIADALKGRPAMDEAEATSSAKTANSKAKAKDPKADDKALEDEATQGTNDSASSPAMGAAKAIEDMTPEELAAHEQLVAAKALVKEAKKARKQAAHDAEVAKEIREGIEEATKAFETLQDRLGTVDELRTRLSVVEKTVVSDEGPSRTVSPEAVAKSQQYQEIETEVFRLEDLARNSTNRDMQKAYAERARDERNKLATLGD